LAPLEQRSADLFATQDAPARPEFVNFPQGGLNRARRRLLDVLGTDAGPQHDQAELEASRRREWASFYRELHRVPEPRTYRAPALPGSRPPGTSLSLKLTSTTPPSAEQHCPPSTTFVHHLDQGRSAKLDIYYHQPDPTL
jgi:hypothetical protein